MDQVVFANNPISGLLMLIGLFLADVFVGLATIYTSAIAFLVAAYSGQDKALVQVQDTSLKQTNPLRQLFSPKISQFFKTAVLNMGIDIFKMTMVKHYS